MTTIITTALGDQRTKSTHVKSGQELITDAPVDNQGKGENFSPTDLLAGSLAACMMTIMDQAGKVHGFSIKGAKADVTKIMTENPRRVAEIIVDIKFPENNYSEKVKKIIEHASRTCPVALSIHSDIKKTILLNF